MSALRKNNVKVSGQGDRAIVFAHGFGCDQAMWRLVAPAFEGDYRVVLFDHAGAGGADPASYDSARYDRLEPYADDVIAICRELALVRPVFVGHSVSAMIGVLAALRAPGLFSQLVLIGPSPCYIDDGDYVGGYSRSDIEGLLDFMDDNFVAWSHAMAPAIMGNADRPELGEELERSFCSTDAAAARQFARVTFLSDSRADLARLNAVGEGGHDGAHTPSLILQCSDDAIAPLAVGRYVQQALAHSELVQLAASGHCPHLSAPAETIAAIGRYLQAQHA